jgi:uncharacterized protein YgiM (DUF1202 family)
MRWSAVLKLLTGIALAIALSVGGLYLVAQYLYTKFTELPPKPVYANDKPSSKSSAKATTKPAPKPPPAAVPSHTPVASPSPTASPKSTEYRARITLGDGLNMRADATADAARVGGVDYNQEVVVLEESANKEWIRIRLPETGEEGWIKSGYTARLDGGN